MIFSPLGGWLGASYNLKLAAPPQAAPIYRQFRPNDVGNNNQPRYGEIRFRLSKLVPGIDLDLVDGWISDRYQQILDETNWQRREVRSVIQTISPYTAGTITLTNGDISIGGIGTAWTTSHTGTALRIQPNPSQTGSAEFYEFSFITATAAVLDRPFQGATGTYSYELSQSVYPLPTDCRVLTSVTDMQGLPLAFLDRIRANNRATAYGPPLEWRWLMDDLSSPPQMLVEVFPIPNLVTSIAVEYVAEERGFGQTTDTTLLPWMRPGCLIAGVEADMLNHVEKFAAADRQEARFQVLLMEMVRTNTANIRPKRMRLAPSFTRRPPNSPIDRLRQMP